MSLDAAVATFAEEARELLEDMEQQLLAMEAGTADEEAVHALFRAAHTIKGSGGLFGFDALVGFTHHVESLIDMVRDGDVDISRALTGLLLRCGDHMAFLVDEALGRKTRAPADGARDAELVAALHAMRGQVEAVPAVADPLSSDPAQPGAPGTTEVAEFSVSVGFGPDVLRNGFDPLSFVRYLSAMGEVKDIQTRCPTMPDLADFDAETCYLACQLTIAGDLDEARIAGVFEFIRDECALSITRMAPSDTVPALVPAPAARPVASLAVEQRTAETGGPAGPAARPEGRAPEQRFLRVEADKLDHLINLIGELVIAGASCNLLATRARNSEMVEATSSVGRLVESIRETALNLRMVQIGATFSRFQRVVRDLSHELGKDIELAISGAETELDKSVVEKIADPLMHLVRNALDHGIESRERRLAAGKSASGLLQLHAFHESGSIVIEVADDGAGLDVDRIRSKAVERGLIAEGANLGEREIHALIFEPGFSTAAAVTNVSGRGVGMDVVRRNIESLRGTIEVESLMGRGTTMRIRLPLTLAIIDGFLVGVGGAAYVLPLDMVMECVELRPEFLQASQGRSYINLRGEVLPFVRLRELFEKNAGQGRRENIVVVKYAGRSAGLVVDELLGDFQTVIKPLGRLFGTVRGISGSTILGSGEVALILDVPSLIALAAERERDSLPSLPASPGNVRNLQ